MTWHLKDRELEKKIIAIDPEFLKRLHINQEILFSPLPPIVPSLLHTHEILKGAPKLEFELRTNKGFLGKLVFDECDLEDIPEYNPHAWNEYPKVKPVEPGIYRLEVKHSAGSPTQYFAAVFDFTSEKGWYVYGQGNLINTSFLNGGYVRFRLWED